MASYLSYYFYIKWQRAHLKQTLHTHQPVSGSENILVQGDMIFSKICFVVAYAHSASLEIHKSLSKVPQWIPRGAKCRLAELQPKYTIYALSHVDVDFVIGFPHKAYGHKSCITSIFDKSLFIPKKALALSDSHLKYILYTVFGSHNCRFMSIRSSSNDIVSKKYNFSAVSDYVCWDSFGTDFWSFSCSDCYDSNAYLTWFRGVSRISENGNSQG